MNKNNKYFFIVFITFWMILTILNFIIPSKSFSENENRMLAKIPIFKIEELMNGKYVNKLNDYINDQFIFRNFWLKINAIEEKALGKTENNGVYIGKDGYLFEKIKYTNESEEKIENLVEEINNFRKNTNITTYFILIPNSIYINQEKLPNFANTFDQEEMIKEVYVRNWMEAYPDAKLYIYAGNGRNDILAMKRVKANPKGFVICPKNSRTEVKEIAHFVSNKEDLEGVIDGLEKINGAVRQRSNKRNKDPEEDFENR